MKRMIACFLLTVSLLARDADANDLSLLARLAVGSGWDALPAIVALERGFFAQQDLVVSPQISSQLGALANSIRANSTDFAVLSQHDLLRAVEAEVPLVVVALNSWGGDPELIVPASPEAAPPTTSEVSELRGARIAVSQGSDSLPVLVRLLDQAGLHASEVQVLSLPPEDLAAAFTSDAADAIFESRHFTRPLVDKGAAEILVSGESVVKALGSRGATALVARRSLVEGDPDEVQRFVNGWVQGLRYIQQDPEDAGRLLQAFFHRQGIGVSKDLALAWVGYSRFDRYVWNEQDVEDASYNAWALVEVGVLKTIPALDAAIDSRFANQSAAQFTKSEERPQ